MLDTQKTTEKASEVAKYVFTAPNPIYTVLPIIVISLILGYFLFNNIYLGLGLFALPTFLSAFISKPLAEIFKGKLYFRRSFLLALLSLIIVFVIAIIGVLIKNFYNILTINLILIFSFSFIIFIRHTILVSTSNSSHLLSFLATVNQTVLLFVFIYLLKIDFTLKELILGILFSEIFLIFSIIFTEVVSLPYKRNFNFNGLTLLRMTLDQITEGSIELEKFYKSFSQKVKLPIKIISFKKINNENEIKALIVVPYVHPGPFGNICGGDLPYKIAKNFSYPILVPHSPTTHDYNLSETKEVDKIVKEVKRLANEIQYENFCSRFFRIEKNAKVSCQMFGRSAFIVYTSSPLPTDDINFHVGKEVEEKAKKFVKNSVFIDAHNCNVKGEGYVHFGSEIANEIAFLTEEIVKTAKESELNEFRIGYAENKEFKENEGIGKQGIQVLIIENNNKKTAYILIDGNNLVIGLREKIISELKEIENAEILTTDNHYLNSAENSYNPIGLLVKEEKLIAKIKETVKNAIINLQNCEVGFNEGEIELFVHGEGNTVKLSSTINSSVGIMKYVFVLSLISAIMLCFLVSYIAK